MKLATFLLSVFVALRSFFVVESSSRKTFSGIDGFSRIKGGSQVEPGEYPYFVDLGNCGGALVASDVVLFAAHCGSRKDREIIVGAYKRGSSDTEGARKRVCKEWIPDPKFGTGGGHLGYDFALCKLDEPVDIFDAASGVRLELNEKDSVPSDGVDLLVMGLGQRGLFQAGPEFVHDVTVPSVSNGVCKADWGSGFTEHNMLCAGYLDTTNMDAYMGDSGGPLVQRTIRNDGSIVDVHVGVVSYGTLFTSSGFPTVYARTSSRAEWIRTTICEDLRSADPACNNSDDNSQAPLDPINCRDSEEFGFNGRKKLSCEFFLRTKKKFYARKRCKKIWKNIPVYDWCPQTCGTKANLGECTSGSNDNNPPVPVDCRDSEEFRFDDRNKLTCEFFLGVTKEAYVKKKCNKTWRNTPVYKWCPQTCGTRANVGACAGKTNTNRIISI